MGLELVRMSPDQVTRKNSIVERNPGLLITTPRQNGTPHYMADWAAGESGMARIHRADLRELLDELVTVHGFEDAC